jgi:hypothetical protein
MMYKKAMYFVWCCMRRRPWCMDLFISIKSLHVMCRDFFYTWSLLSLRVLIVKNHISHIRAYKRTGREKETGFQFEWSPLFLGAAYQEVLDTHART